MALQLVYTSAAKLLDAGRSGFGTVARSKTISPLVVSAIERVSQFSNLRGDDRTRMIFVHRRIIAANNRFHLLSRIRDAGADYTGRTHHIAHHLIVTQDEVARAAAGGITPADVLSQFAWMDRWEGAARFFGLSDDVPLEMFQPMGRNSKRGEWTRLTGNPALARTLAWEGAPRSGVLLVPREADPLALMSEALHEFGVQSWSRSFTTSLETTDEMSDIDWVISSPENFSEIQGRCGARTILDLGHPQTLTVPPEPVIRVPQRQTAAEALTRDPDAPFAPTFGDSAGVPGPQPGTVRVRTRNAPPTGRAGRAPSLSSPKKNRNSWVLISALSFVAVALLGAIVWGIMQLKQASEKKQTTPTLSNVHIIKLSDGQEQAIRDLDNIKINKEEARNIIAKAGPENFNVWKTFIIESNKQFKELSVPQNEIVQKLQLPRIPNSEVLTGVPIWTGALVDVVRNISELIDVKHENDWIKKIDQCRDQLKSIIKDGGLPFAAGNSDQAADQVAKNLFLYFAAKRLDEVLKNPGDGKLDGLLQIVNCWDREKFIERYDLLKQKIQMAYSPPKGIDAEKFKALFPEIEANKGLFKEDYEGLKEFKLLYEAPNYTPDKLKQLSQDKQNLIKNSALVPESIKNSFNPPTSDPPKPKKGDGNDLPNVKPVKTDQNAVKQPAVIQAPEKQVILVSREELKNGVEVALLKALLSVYSGNTLKENGLTIAEGDVPINELIEVPNQGYFSKSYLGKNDEIKIYKDGRVSIDRDEVGCIKLNYKSSGKTYESFIVVDVKNAEPLVEKLQFKIEYSGSDIKLSGSLAEWIRNVGPAKEELLLFINGSTETTVSIKGPQIVHLPGWPLPSKADMIFPLKEAGEFKKTLIDIQAAKKKLHDLAPKPLEKRTMENDLADKCERLVKALEESVGKTFAEKVFPPTVFNGDQISIDECDKVIAGMAPFVGPPPKGLDVMQKSHAELKNALDKESKQMTDIDEKIKKAGDDKTKEELKKEKVQIKENIANKRKQFFESVGASILMNGPKFDLPKDFAKYQKCILIPGESLDRGLGMGPPIQFFEIFMKRATKPLVPIEQQRKDYLDKINILRVQTQHDRVLFEATRN